MNRVYMGSGDDECCELRPEMRRPSLRVDVLGVRFVNTTLPTDAGLGICSVTVTARAE